MHPSLTQGRARAIDNLKQEMTNLAERQTVIIQEIAALANQREATLAQLRTASRDYLSLTESFSSLIVKFTDDEKVNGSAAKSNSILKNASSLTYRELDRLLDGDNLLGLDLHTNFQTVLTWVTIYQQHEATLQATSDRLRELHVELRQLSKELHSFKSSLAALDEPTTSPVEASQELESCPGSKKPL